MTPQLGGVFTVSDDELYLNLLALKDSLDAEVEPSAAAAVSGAGLAAGLGRQARLCAGPSHGQRHARHLGHRRSLVPRDAARLPGTRQDAAPAPRGLSRHVPLSRRSSVSRRYPADSRLISGRFPADPIPTTTFQGDNP